MSKIIAACGNDCAACPRYVAHPCEKTEKELRRTAELWQKIGYRDHVVSNAEISCTGCRPENWCRYHVVKCCQEKGIRTCGECPSYPCENIKECFAVTKSFELQCRRVCSTAEYAAIKRAFFEKEKNLRAEQLKNPGTEQQKARLAEQQSQCEEQQSQCAGQQKTSDFHADRQKNAVCRKRIVFCGWVQGVGFRYHAKYAAADAGCTGWVKNEYDGSVTMEIQGTEEAIDRVILAIESARYVRIENMEVRRLPVDPAERGFRVR